MKKVFISFIFILFAFNIFCGELYQLGTINALMKGVYENVQDSNSVKSLGNIGLGTTTKLGELAMIDSRIYITDWEGKTSEIRQRTEIPYFTCARFSQNTKFRVETPISSKDLYALIDSQHLSGENIFYAIKIDGTFQSIKARSQKYFTNKPEPLGEWLKKNQTTFDFSDIKGTIIVFRFPKAISGVGVGGYHAHFISDTRKSGGHVYDFVLTRGRVLIESYNKITLILPEPDKKALKDGSANQPSQGDDIPEDYSAIE